MARQYKKNTVKLDIGSYFHYWRGIKKVGKTTLFYELLLEEYGTTDAGLHINIGNETGADTLDDFTTVTADNWSELIDIRDDLVENKSDNIFKLICLDTADEMVKLAIQETLRIHKKLKGSAASSINDCLGGYGAGRKKVEELIDDVLTSLRRAGYGLVVVGHTKLKDIKEKTGDEYQQLTSNLSADYDGIFSNKADIIMTISVDKHITDGLLSGTQRYLHFRDDGFVDCGSRFKEMPSKVEYGAKQYIDAFRSGVKSSMTNKIDDKEYEKNKKSEITQREKAAKEYVSELKENKVDEEKNSEYVSIIQAKFPKASDETKIAVKKIMSNYKFAKFSDDDIPTKALKEIVELLG